MYEDEAKWCHAFGTLSLYTLLAVHIIYISRKGSGELLLHKCLERNCPCNKQEADRFYPIFSFHTPVFNGTPNSNRNPRPRNGVTSPVSQDIWKWTNRLWTIAQTQWACHFLFAVGLWYQLVMTKNRTRMILNSHYKTKWQERLRLGSRHSKPDKSFFQPLDVTVNGS